MKPRICVLTDISHLEDVYFELSGVGELHLSFDLPIEDMKLEIEHADYIFTNPNKATVYLGEQVLAKAKNLKAICSASTGLTHIDLDYCAVRGVQVISIRKDRAFLEELPSTAELALTLTLMGLRNIREGLLSVSSGNWDYRPLIGSQFRGQSVGVIGLGRLGSMYASFAKALGGDVFYVDPNVRSKKYTRFEKVEELFEECRVISVHAHAEPQLPPIVDLGALSGARPNLILVNTARGEVVDEEAVLEFLSRNPSSQYLADVLRQEEKLAQSSVYQRFLASKQVTLTPHVGGMTHEGQTKAYMHAAKKLSELIRTESHKNQPRD